MTHDPSASIRRHVAVNLDWLVFISTQIYGVQVRWGVAIQESLGAVPGVPVQHTSYTHTHTQNRFYDGCCDTVTRDYYQNTPTEIYLILVDTASNRHIAHQGWNLSGVYVHPLTGGEDSSDDSASFRTSNGLQLDRILRGGAELSHVIGDSGGTQDHLLKVENVFRHFILKHI